MNWGVKIILSFVVFIGVIFTLAYISMNQDISLVSENYYEQELAYEDQIQRIKNTQSLSERPQVVVNREAAKVQLVFPESLRASIDEGKLHFFRPSNAALDKDFTISLDQDGKQSFEVKDFSQGLWKAQITWKYRNKEYYQEVNLVF